MAITDAYEEDLRREVRDWIAANRIDGLEPGGAHPPYDHTASAAEIEWVERLREGAWLCLTWPECYGGRGLGLAEVVAVNEEFARAGLPRPTLGMGESLVAPALFAHGTPEQQDRFLPRILSGQDRYCQGFSEPGAGSDLASLRTVGVLDGDEVVITGQKVWTSGAHRANLIFTLCRTDPDAPRHRGISYVLVPMADNGIEIRPLRQMVGDHGFNQVFLDRARAPLANVIGGLHNGWRVAMTTLASERGGNATTQHLGYLSEWTRLVDLARDNGALARPTVRSDLARAYTAIRIMEFSGGRLVSEMTRKGPAGPQASVGKVFWSEYHRWFGELAMQISGPAGLVRPPGPGYAVSEFQRIFLESRARTIARGSSQVQRNIMAEQVLGLPRDPVPSPTPKP
ncbi:MAG: acyl-CoA dehydrogenase family protein [Acidimicrobiales bacterium]